MKRIAVVDESRCHPHKCGNYLCERFCPVNRAGTECIVHDPGKKVRIIEPTCIGCNICVVKCPFDAITIVNLPEALDREPIHRFGKNAFALFNLPTPIFGKVVGILGRNGIGKSTAVKILAGLIEPNLGRAGPATRAEVLDYFKGTEAQAYFERAHRGDVKVAYKPQEVDLIPKQASGTVRQLLARVDERQRMAELVRLLELDKVLDADIGHVSGGELQRVAIAATALRAANVYIFDEPTSFLDVKQRLKVAQFIRSLADEKTAVLVIEHDLIILDAASDLVHLMYGQEGAYGIVSQVKTAKAGINVFLSGYLRDENVRFRDKPIKFERRPPQEQKRDTVLTTWPAFTHPQGRFTLDVREGRIFAHDVVGILGANGIGKTTFVRLLAGELPNPAAQTRLRVAYKPQYLGKDETPVATALLGLQKYETLLRPLALERLMDRTLLELSGGELQRVAIARTLIQDADLYLLDEPSAYLDVEQRLVMSKVIREMMEQRGKAALVVDHDLLFLDYLSQKLLVFEGEPAVRGAAAGPFGMEAGMNRFLADLGLTFRRDEESLRPRANKPGSQMDIKQKEEGKLYYV